MSLLEQTEPSIVRCAELTPLAIHEALIASHNPVVDIFNDDLQLADLYERHRLKGILLSPVSDGAKNFYERHPSTHDRGALVGAAILDREIDPEYYMMWVPSSIENDRR